MRIATRTALAALAAATVAVLSIAAVGRGQLTRTLEDRVDQQLLRRSDSAPVLAAVADRLAASELGDTVEGARVLRDGTTVAVGDLPDGPLPPIEGVGFTTARVGAQRWRLLTVAVDDVPTAGDQALVQLVAPLGDVDAANRRLRRRGILLVALVTIGAGLAGYVFGSIATRPLSRLRRAAASVGDDPTAWTPVPTYGAVEVDDVARALDASVARIAAEMSRRDEALEAARSFASGATHELRTPLQSAMTNLDIAASAAADPATRDESLRAAREQLRRAASSLTAVRALADAELVDRAAFSAVDLVELVEAVIGDEARRDPDAVELRAQPGQPPVSAWRDGVELAVGNLVRNALTHGRAPVVVTVDGAVVTVDDSGNGIAAADRDRVTRRFERGATDIAGSGIGLAIVREVAEAHGGSLTVASSPTGGARLVMRLA